MAFLSSHFPPEVQPYIQSGTFEVMKLMEHVGVEFGSNTMAFKQALRELRGKCSLIQSQMTDRVGVWENISETANPLSEVPMDTQPTGQEVPMDTQPTGEASGSRFEELEEQVMNYH